LILILFKRKFYISIFKHQRICISNYPMPWISNPALPPICFVYKNREVERRNVYINIKTVVVNKENGPTKRVNYARSNFLSSVVVFILEICWTTSRELGRTT
jgi:hypothetical protein